MQRGILKHYAHVLPRIFAERVLWEDVPVLVRWGQGHLAIDVVAGECRRDRGRRESLHITGELQAWLARELAKQHDPPKDVRAELEIEFSATGSTSEADLIFDVAATVTSGGEVFADRFSVTQGISVLQEDPPTPLSPPF